MIISRLGRSKDIDEVASGPKSQSLIKNSRKDYYKIKNQTNGFGWLLKDKTI